MKPDFAPAFRRLRLCCLGLAIGPLTAQIPIGGNQSGTLAAGIYTTSSSLSVATGQTWTLSPGVIIKFTNQGHEVSVNGTLNVNGTAANKVIFTDYADDTAGGDTNGNGPSAGNATSWRGIVFNSTGGGTLNYADVRYGGSAFVANVHLNSSSPILNNCILRNNFTSGLNCSTNSTPTVTNCTFRNNGGFAIDAVSMAALAGFSGNTATGNGTGNYARVTSGTVSGNVTVPPSAHINGAIVFDAPIVVPSSATLTVQAGTVLKMRNQGIEVRVDGTLNVNGIAGNPVIFTDLADDSAGGDTNGNGASAGNATSWRGIVFNSTGGGTLNHADVRYGGSAFVANVHLNSSSPILNNCILRNNFTSGLNCSTNSTPTVTNCTFTNNGGFAIDAVSMAALAGFSGNTATGNGAGNYARVTSGTVSGNVAVPPSAHINGAIVFDATIVVPPSATLTVQAGTVLKMRNQGIEVRVDGTLNVNGIAGNPVIFTGLADDSAGGDTNGNGASAGNATSWRGIVFNSTGGGTLNHADVRYGGSAFVANVHLNSSSPTLNNCILRNNFTSGLNCNGNSAPIVRNCMFVDNGAYAVEGLQLTAVPGFTNNTASGNGLGNGLHITDGIVDGPLTISPQSVMAGALVMGTHLNVTTTGVLTVQQGVHFKFQSAGLEAVVDGTMNLRGTAFEPVVFTAYNDDSIGGDTNNNGPSSGSPTGWRGITYNALAPASSIENALVRFTGSAFVPAFTCANNLVSVRALRVEHAFDRGIVLSAVSGTAVNLVAWQCGGIGIHLTGGDSTVAHATATGNGVGMQRETAWTGAVVNSISRGNGTNFANFASSQVLFSNGAFPAVNGNIDVDPQFVGVAQGDLRLGATSPCLGSADLLPALLAVKDFEENSRFLDHSLVGLPLPDMGAHERGAWDMTVGGTSQVGTTLTYTVTGPPGVSFYLLGFLDGFAPLVPYGLVLVAAQPSSVLVLNPTPVLTNAPFLLSIPNIPALEGLTVGIQSLTLSSSSASVGNVTRMHRILLRP